MNDNIKIALILGWTQIENANTMAINGIWKGYPPSGFIIGKKEYIPDYKYDLNHCHEFEKTLTEQEGGEYDSYLWIIINRDKTRPAYWHATAEQKCEAFLMIKNKLNEL